MTRVSEEGIAFLVRLKIISGTKALSLYMLEAIELLYNASTCCLFQYVGKYVLYEKYYNCKVQWHLYFPSVLVCFWAEGKEITTMLKSSRTSQGDHL